MADRRRKHNALLGSARVLTGEARIESVREDGWERELWKLRDMVGELRAAEDWHSTTLSRCRLLAASPPANPGDEPEPLDAGPAVDLVENLAGGIGGQSELLAGLGANLFLIGDAYVVGRKDDAGLSWAVRSKGELRQTSRRAEDGSALWEVKVGNDDWDPLPEESMIVRVWRPHRRWHWMADTATRAALPVLRELVALTAHIDATITSRLAGAGLFFLPQEATFPLPADSPGVPDAFMAELNEAMETALRDPGSAAARVPIVAQVPGAMIQWIKGAHVTFATPLDDKAISLREEAIRRFGTAIDMPVEVLLGLGDVNHWGAWQIEESGLKIHVIPVLELVGAALTTGYLQPALDSLSEDPNSAIVWYDTSELSVRPDRSSDALSLYDRLEATGETARRESGLGDADQPSMEELRRRLLLQWAQSDPLSVPTVIRELGLRPVGATTLEVTGGPAGNGAAPDQVETPDDRRELPPTQETPPPAPDETALVAACDGLVFRALERAGNKLRSYNGIARGSTTDCPPAVMHTCIDVTSVPRHRFDVLLAGAWDRVPELAEALNVDAEPLTETLDAYTRSLLAARQPHSWERLASALGAS